MQVTINELEKAYKQSRLPSLGYSFQSALACSALKICLVRIATNLQKKAATGPLSPQGASPQNIGAKAPYSYVKQYWWQNI